EGGGTAVVVGDQAGPAGTVEVGVPGPGQVAGVLGVQPGHQRVDVAVGAVVLADLSGDDRDLGDDRGDLAGPAGLVVAGVEVVGVPGRDQAVVRVGGLVGQPLGQVVGPFQPAEHDHVAGAGRADGVDQGLHPGHGVGDADAVAAAVEPALPALGLVVAVGLLRVGLVEQVEDDRVVALERAGDRGPERHRLGRVRHRLLAHGLGRGACGRTAG